MKKKNSLILDDEFLLYCQINNIDDVEKLARDTFNRGFTLLKYGEIPMGIKGKEKIIEKEVIKEIIKEVPVEKIIEVFKEIPVEKIVEVVKEIPVKEDQIVIKEVVKEVLVADNSEVNRLLEQNKKLNDELDNIKKSLESLNKAKYMRNSDMSTLYGE